jgi:hypothetical protein
MPSQVRSRNKRTVKGRRTLAPSALSRYSAATQQILDGGVTLAKMLGLVDPVGDTRELARQRRLEPVLRELEIKIGSWAWCAVFGRLIAYLNPLEQARLDEAARRLPHYQTIVREELRSRERLLASLKADFSIWPLPPTLLGALIQDCEGASHELGLLLSRLKATGTILKRSEAASLDKRTRKNKPRRPAARRAEQSLLKFFFQQGMSRLRAADYTHRIIEAWEPTATSSKESIRTASLQRPAL